VLLVHVLGDGETRLDPGGDVSLVDVETARERRGFLLRGPAAPLFHDAAKPAAGHHGASPRQLAAHLVGQSAGLRGRVSSADDGDNQGRFLLRHAATIIACPRLLSIRQRVGVRANLEVPGKAEPAAAKAKGTSTLHASPARGVWRAQPHGLERLAAGDAPAH